jgi:hypothetical protein
VTKERLVRNESADARKRLDVLIPRGRPRDSRTEYLAVTRLQADALVTVDAAMATRAEGPRAAGAA